MTFLLWFLLGVNLTFLVTDVITSDISWITFGNGIAVVALALALWLRAKTSKLRGNS